MTFIPMRIQMVFKGPFKDTNMNKMEKTHGSTRASTPRAQRSGLASEDEAHPFIQAPQGLLSPHPEIVLAIDARHTRHRLFRLRELLDASILAPH